MLQEPFEIHIEDSIIYWDFCLKDENDPKMDYTLIPEQKRSLNDLLKDFNYQIQLKLEQNEKKQENPDRARRKLAKNLLKGTTAKLSEFANEIGESKQQLKKFFMKEDQETETKNHLSDKIKNWLEPIMMSLPRQQTQLMSKKFVKSYFKDSQARPESKYIDDIYLIYMDKFIPHSNVVVSETANLIEIDLNLSIQDRAITDSFLWDPEKTHELDIWMYTKYLLKDLLLEYDITTTDEQFQTLHEETRIQLRTQLQYKLLLNKYKPLLVSFATLQTNQVRQYVIPIEVRVIDNDGKLIFNDDFEWDILNQNNNVEQFCQILIKDEEISEQIRTQIYNELNWKFICLSNTFKPLLKERELPKLKNQATGQIKKNIIYTLDMPLPINPDAQNNTPVNFHNSEMYSILSKNYDILPKQYQAKISFEKETQTESQAEAQSKPTIQPFKIQGHPYLPSNLFSQFDSNRIRNIYNNLINGK